MSLSQAQLEGAAADSGFQVEALEKVLRLVELLEALRSHPFLKERVVLKGGTALNLFVLDLPRLSVDVDLNYVGAVDRETMLAERPRVERAIRAVCERVGIEVRRKPSEHAGGKWRLAYARAAGGSGVLELDLNFVMRVPLWDPVARDSLAIASTIARRILVQDVHELAAGKLAALFGRDASRDLFDVRELLSRDDLDREKLRLAFVVYGGMSRRDWRGVSIDEVRMDPRDADRKLLPLLRANIAPARRDVPDWCANLTEECRAHLSAVLPLEPRELGFLDRLLYRGEIAPELLTDDADLRESIRTHPGLLWRALNIQRRLGADV